MIIAQGCIFEVSSKQGRLSVYAILTMNVSKLYQEKN